MACLNSCAGATERLPDSLQAIPAWSLQAAPEASQRGSLGYLLLPTKSVVAVRLGASFAGRRVWCCGTLVCRNPCAGVTERASDAAGRHFPALMLDAVQGPEVRGLAAWPRPRQTPELGNQNQNQKLIFLPNEIFVGRTPRCGDSGCIYPVMGCHPSRAGGCRGALALLGLPDLRVGASAAGRRVCSCGTHGVPEFLRCGDAGAPRCCGAAISPFDVGCRAGPRGAGIGGVTAPATDSGAREPKSKIFKILQNEIFVGQGLPDSWDPGVFILLWYGPPCWVLGWSPRSGHFLSLVVARSRLIVDMDTPKVSAS